MLVIYGNVQYDHDYENRITETFSYLISNVGPEVKHTHHFRKGVGWQGILLAASGFDGIQIWAVTIYDQQKETFFRLKYSHWLDNPYTDHKRISQLMEQNIDRLLIKDS